MNVTLINHTQDAATLLMFTKATRLNMSPQLLDEINHWPAEKREKELAYMATTIPSSWEFADVTFLVEGVSRACAQQMTRTRTASYAMQSQRVLDVSDAEVVAPEKFKSDHHRAAWDNTLANTMSCYKFLIEEGMPAQDARGLLPMNITCNLVAKYNLRNFVDLAKARASLRAQGEYVEVVAQMKQEVLRVWPWAETFFADKHAQAIEMLEAAATKVGITTGYGPGWEIAKAIDLLRKSA